MINMKYIEHNESESTTQIFYSLFSSRRQDDGQNHDKPIIMKMTKKKNEKKNEEKEKMKK